MNEVAVRLLARMRESPMRRGAGSRTQACRRQQIAAELRTHGAPDDLARRIALQLVLKIDGAELADRSLWPAMSRVLREEATLIATHVGLSDTQIAVALPKLAAQAIIDFHHELMAADRTIARTILNASLMAADPLEAGRRYLAEYQNVLKQLGAIDPLIARTLANATFTASEPRKKAMEFMGRFAEVLATFQGDIEAARRVAKASYRASDRRQAAQTLAAEYDAAVAQLVKGGVDLPIARMLAGLKHIRDADGPVAATTPANGRR